MNPEMKKHLENVVQAMIKDDVEGATEHLKQYFPMKVSQVYRDQTQQTRATAPDSSSDADAE